MKILLTGSSGFVGRNFKESFSKKYEVFAPEKEEANFADVRSAAAYFRDKKFDAVVHAASRREDGETENALVVFKNVQYNAVLTGVKKLLVIGDESDIDDKRILDDVDDFGYVSGFPHDDFGAFIPSDPYGLSRYLITKLALSDKISSVLRLWNPYGKYLNVSESKTMELIARGVTGKKIAFAAANNEYSAVYIDDVLRVIEAFLTSDIPKGVYNVAGLPPLKENEVARLVKRLAAKDDRAVEIVVDEQEEKKSTCKTDRLAEVLNKFRFTAHSAAIKELYEYLKKHKSLARPRTDA